MSTIIALGHEWEVRGYPGAPGPNQFNAANVSVDSAGNIHLKAQPIGGVWNCAEARTDQLYFGFGTLEFHVLTDLSKLDVNVVFAMFVHERDSTPGVEEADIEYAEWGDPNYAKQWQGKDTVFPEAAGNPLTDHQFKGSPAGPSVHRIIRSATGIQFQHLDSKGNQWAGWNFSPTNPQILIPQKPLLAFVQLWLINGKAPTDGKPVDIAISQFKFTPQGG